MLPWSHQWPRIIYIQSQNEHVSHRYVHW
jgi:hypothetical protein